MERISATAAWVWFSGGVVWFLVWIGLVIGVLGKTPRPPESPHMFFSSAQYNILFAAHGKQAYDPQHPNSKFCVNLPNSCLSPKQQIDPLAKWGFNDCVKTDGLADQKTGFLDSGCFCENAPAVQAIFAGGAAVQPQNTLSTFSLSMAGLIILGLLVFRNPPPQQNFMNVTYVFALCYAFMTILLGPLSMALHLGLSDSGGWFDSLSLYIWFSFVACYGFFRLIVACVGLEPNEDFPWWGYMIFLAVWVGAITVPAAMTAPGANGPIPSDIWYLILGGLALFGELLLGIRNWTGWGSDHKAPAGTWNFQFSPWDIGGRWWFVLGGATFLLALTIWTLSFTRKPLCAPHSLQGHAVFHTLSALALACLYKYYRQEDKPA